MPVSGAELSDPVQADASAARRRRIVRAAGFVATATFVFLVFMFKLSVTNDYGIFNITYYDELADAFLAGQTYLLREPPPEMLALPDPWDPASNESFRKVEVVLHGERFDGFHDLSLYHGKLYLQWGPVPALVIIPFRWLAGHDLPLGDVGLIVQTLAALTFALSTLKLGRLAGLPQSRLTTFMIFVLFLWFPIWTYNTITISIYEFGVYFTQLFLSCALLCTVAGFERLFGDRKSPAWWFAAASLLLGLAINCRVDVAPLGMLIPVLFYIWIRADPHLRAWRRTIVPALGLGGPAALLLGCALFYNKVRFGGFFDVGQDWQLWGGEQSMWLHKFSYLSVSRILPNIYYYFFAPLARFYKSDFLLAPPYLAPKDWMGPELAAAYGPYYERTAGIFAACPITVLALLFPLSFVLRSPTPQRARARWIVLFLIACSVLIGGPLFLAPAVMRYCAQWCMWWLIASILMTLQIRAGLRSQGWRGAAAVFDLGLVAATAWTSWIGFCLLLLPHLWVQTPALSP